MFALSEVRKVAHLLTDCLPIDEPQLTALEIEVVDVSQTVRINENNQYIVKSPLSRDAVVATLQENRGFKKAIVASHEGAGILEHVIASMIERLQIDSYLGVGKAHSPVAWATLQSATEDSKKPLLVFDAMSRIDFAALTPKWLDADHPAIWIGRDWLPSVEGAEAFFGISPELKLEISLNRYQPLIGFGDFAVGLVRL